MRVYSREEDDGCKYAARRARLAHTLAYYANTRTNMVTLSIRSYIITIEHKL